MAWKDFLDTAEKITDSLNRQVEYGLRERRRRLLNKLRDKSDNQIRYLLHKRDCGELSDVQIDVLEEEARRRKLL